TTLVPKRSPATASPNTGSSFGLRSCVAATSCETSDKPASSSASPREEERVCLLQSMDLLRRFSDGACQPTLRYEAPPHRKHLTKRSPPCAGGLRQLDANRCQESERNIVIIEPGILRGAARRVRAALRRVVAAHRSIAAATPAAISTAAATTAFTAGI